MSFKEKLFEGKYNYLQDGKIYTQENFTVLKEDKIQGEYTYNAEVLTRVRTGEFLKVFIEAYWGFAFTPNLSYNMNLKSVKEGKTLSCIVPTKNIFIS